MVIMRTLLISLLLIPSLAFAVPSVGSSGWICANYVDNADLHLDSLTIDSGSNRVLVTYFSASFIEDTEFVIDTVGGQAPTASDDFDVATGENGEILSSVFSESAISAMSGSAISLSGGNGDDFRFCYVTLTDVDQTNLASYDWDFFNGDTSVATLDVSISSDSDDYACVFGYHEDSTGTWTSWDTLTEIDDNSTNNGGRAGIGCGAGGDSVTTVTTSTTTDISLVSVSFSDFSGALLLRRRR